MNRLLAYGIAGLIVCAGLQQANATLVFENSGIGTVEEGGVGSSATGLLNVLDTDSGTVTFDWTGTPYTAHLSFTIDTSWTLSLESFDVIPGADTGSNDVSAYVLDQIDGFGGADLNRFTVDTDFANSAEPPVQGDANLFGLPGTTNPSASVAEAGDLLGTFGPGTYRLGAYDSGTPDMANAVFAISAIPEAGALAVWSLLSGVGLVSCGRRKRTSDDEQSV